MAIRRTTGPQGQPRMIPRVVAHVTHLARLTTKITLTTAMEAERSTIVRQTLTGEAMTPANPAAKGK